MDAANRYFVFTNRETGPDLVPNSRTSGIYRSPFAPFRVPRAFFGSRPRCRWPPCAIRST